MILFLMKLFPKVSAEGVAALDAVLAAFSKKVAAFPDSHINAVQPGTYQGLTSVFEMGTGEPLGYDR